MNRRNFMAGVAGAVTAPTLGRPILSRSRDRAELLVNQNRMLVRGSRWRWAILANYTKIHNRFPSTDPMWLLRLSILWSEVAEFSPIRIGDDLSWCVTNIMGDRNETIWVYAGPQAGSFYPTALDLFTHPTFDVILDRT